MGLEGLGRKNFKIWTRWIRPKNLDQWFWLCTSYSFLMVRVRWNAAENSEESLNSRRTAVHHRRHNGIYNNWK
jgi:hypothetical protein